MTALAAVVAPCDRPLSLGIVINPASCRDTPETLHGVVQERQLVR
jgi:hypothetical protein